MTKYRDTKHERGFDGALAYDVKDDKILFCAGIWEPVAAPQSSFLSLFTGAWKPQPPLEIVGAMAYFTPYSTAPRISIEDETGSTKLNIAWRLLWRDERYTDRGTPEVETQYGFLEPDKSRPRSSGPPSDDDYVWAESGAAAQLAGRWTIESDTYSVMREKARDYRLFKVGHIAGFSKSHRLSSDRPRAPRFLNT